MAALQTQLPPWLAEAFGPKQPDPPWILDAMRLGMQRQQMKAKLPLELQQMELANKANQLEIETRGLQNDLVNQEMDHYAQALPAIRDWKTKSLMDPGLAPPAVLSKKAASDIADWQKIMAETTLGQANAQALTIQIRQAADVARILKITVPRNPDGSFDPEQLAALVGRANEVETAKKQADEIASITAGVRARGLAEIAQDEAALPGRLKEIELTEGIRAKARIASEAASLPGELQKIEAVEAARLKARIAGEEALLPGEIKKAEALEAARAKFTKPPADQVGLEYTRMKAAESSGDAALAEFHKGRLLKLSQSTGTTIRTNPDGSVEIVQGAPVGGPESLTKPNLTKVQESQAQSLATIDVANRLEPLISTETVGVQAFAESWVKDRILAQRFPEMASGQRAKAEQLAAQLRASAVKELRSDSNITEGERRQIMGAIPQINDPVDSPARAKELVRNVRKMSAIRALVAAKRMGGEAPKAAALVLDDEDLVELSNQGLITQEIATQAYQLKRK